MQPLIGTLARIKATSLIRFRVTRPLIAAIVIMTLNVAMVATNIHPASAAQRTALSVSQGLIPPAVGRNVDGRLEAFVLETDGTIRHKWQTCAGCGWSSGWSILGSNFDSAPAVGVEQGGALDVFALGGDGKVYHNYQTCGGCWSGWSQLISGEIATSGIPVVSRNADGRLEVYIKSQATGLYHAWESCAACPSQWQGWSSMGNPDGSGNVGWSDGRPAVFLDNNGYQELFANFGNPGVMVYNHQAQPSGGWSGWQYFPRPPYFTAEPALISNPYGQMEVFAKGNDNIMYHGWQSCNSCTNSWTAWSALGSYTYAGANPYDGAPGVGMNSDGRLEVFARGSDSQIHHVWQNCAGCGWTTGSYSIGGSLFGNVAVAQNSNGYLSVLAVDYNNNVEIDSQCGGGCWTGWASLGS